MIFTIFLSRIGSAAIIVIAAFSAIGQTKRPDFNRPRTFDAQNYTIRARFAPSAKKVFGDTTVSLKPLNADFKSVELDAIAFTFQSVTLEPSGADLSFTSTREKVIITLDRAYSPSETISIRLKYTVTPKQGVYFIGKDAGDGGNHSAQIWSQGEAEEARHWFPSFDFPSDKATTEEYITADKDETVIGNGEFLGKTNDADGKVTWHYKMPIPHSTYLVSFVIGKYSKLVDSYKGKPLGFYVYPGKESTGVNAFGDTKKMIAAFESLTGIDFPYNKYDQTVVAKFEFGGMENITATTMLDTEIYFADFDAGKEIVTDLVSHELAHSWFGDMVTCRNWAELWLNEGFATYMEAAYREKAYGRTAYIGAIMSKARDFYAGKSSGSLRRALYNTQAGDVASLFKDPSVTYSKGGVVLHMLREQVGTETFWKAINLYLNRHKFDNVESTDLKNVMEEVSGQDLGWFFDQWVYGTGSPRLEINESYTSATKTLTVNVSQTQVSDGVMPETFRLPMDILIHTAAGDVVQKADVTKRVQSFSFTVDSRPGSIQVDNDDKIPLKQIKVAQIKYVK